MHRDLKPSNIVLNKVANEYRAKVCDFGLSREVSGIAQYTAVRGTPGYMAPEVISGHYNHSLDVYSYGIV